MSAADWLGLLITVSAVLLVSLVLLRISRPGNTGAGEKQSLLDEIEAWERDVISCGFGGEFGDAENVADVEQLRIYTLSRLSDMRRAYVAIRGRGRNMSRKAAFFSQELQEMVLALTEHLVVHISLLQECYKAVPKDLSPASRDEFDSLLSRAIADEGEVEAAAYEIAERISRIRTAEAEEV